MARHRWNEDTWVSPDREVGTRDHRDECVHCGELRFRLCHPVTGQRATVYYRPGVRGHLLTARPGVRGAPPCPRRHWRDDPPPVQVVPGPCASDPPPEYRPPFRAWPKCDGGHAPEG